MKIGGLAVPYGPSEYHAEVMQGALKAANGEKVPLLHDFGEPDIIGHAELIETEEGIYAILNFITRLTDEELIDIAKHCRIGGRVDQVKCDEQHRVIGGRVTSVIINGTSAIEPLEIIRSDDNEI